MDYEVRDCAPCLLHLLTKCESNNMHDMRMTGLVEVKKGIGQQLQAVRTNSIPQQQVPSCSASARRLQTVTAANSGTSTSTAEEATARTTILDIARRLMVLVTLPLMEDICLPLTARTSESLPIREIIDTTPLRMGMEMLRLLRCILVLGPRP